MTFCVFMFFFRTQGFKRIKMLNKGNAPCCFVEYQVKQCNSGTIFHHELKGVEKHAFLFSKDIYSASMAMSVLQG